MLPAGRYLFYFRTDKTAEMNLSSLRAFLSPNLLEKSPPTIITSWTTTVGFGPENLTTNLRTRADQSGRFAIIDEFGDVTTDFGTCFQAFIDNQSGPVDSNFMSLHFENEVFVNSVFLALDTLGGRLGTVSNLSQKYAS